MDVGLTALITMLREAGPWAAASVFIYLWWEERKERRACQSSNVQLQETRVREAQENARLTTVALTENITKLEVLEGLVKTLSTRGR
jgi:hypothetical protein